MAKHEEIIGEGYQNYQLEESVIVEILIFPTLIRKSVVSIMNLVFFNGN